MKRSFDFLSSFILLILLFPILLLIALIIKADSLGPVLFWSKRVGIKNKTFLMPKFRTMKIDTPIVATHLLTSPDIYLTTFGAFMRRSSLDEIPQLWSILIGDMSFVGPRPALFNQNDLISLRSQYGVDKLLPGLTGWAQVNGRDELSISAKVQYDMEYLQYQSFWFDMKILGLTILKVIRRSGVSH